MVQCTVLFQLFLQQLGCVVGQLFDGAPRLAHPPNSLHFDRRYGVAVGPNQEQFTGDVVVITVEDTESSADTIFNVWSINDLGQVTCIDPIAGGGAYQQQTSKAYEGYGSAAPDYGDDYSSGWSPSLAHMFVVTVVDGRLGQFYLSPIVTFPQSPKYITPQPRVTRSGVASSIGSDGWALGEDEVLTVNSFIPPGEPFYGYSVGFYYDSSKSAYSYRDGLSGGGYGNMNKDGVKGGKTFSTSQSGYSSSSQYSSSGGSSYTANGYEDGGRQAIRGSTAHEFCRCDGGLIKCFNVGQAFLSYPTETNTVPVYSWFKMNKIPSQVARRQMENYQAAISGGLPRSFLLFTALPFTDRVDAQHFHGAEALLSSRRVRLGMIRMTTRGTKQEQQATLVMRNLISDTISFSITFAYIQGLFFEIGDLPVIPIFTPFSDTHKKSVMMNRPTPQSLQNNQKKPTKGSLGDYDEDQHIHFKTASQAKGSGRKTKTTMSKAPLSMYLDPALSEPTSKSDTLPSHTSTQKTMQVDNQRESQFMGLQYKKQDAPLTLPMGLVKLTSYLESCYTGSTTTNTTYPGHAQSYKLMQLFRIEDDIALHEQEFQTKKMTQNCTYIHLPESLRLQLTTRANRHALNDSPEYGIIPKNMTNSLTVGVQQQLLQLLQNHDIPNVLREHGKQCTLTPPEKTSLLEKMTSLNSQERVLLISAVVSSHYNSVTHANTVEVVDQQQSQEGDQEELRAEAVQEAQEEQSKKTKKQSTLRRRRKKDFPKRQKEELQTKHSLQVFGKSVKEGNKEGVKVFGEKNLEQPGIWSEGDISLATGATDQAVQERVLAETDVAVRKLESQGRKSTTLSHKSTNTLSDQPASRRFQTQQTSIPLIDAIIVGEELRFDFAWTFSTGSVIEFAGEYAMIVPPNTAHVGHVMQHLGYATMPFSQDMVRQDWFWSGQWIADMHLPADPVEVAATAGFSAFASTQNNTKNTFSMNSNSNNKTTNNNNTTHRTKAPLMSYAEAVQRKHASKTMKTCSRPESTFLLETKQVLPSTRKQSVLQLSNENSCLDPFAGGMMADFTVRRASVEQDLFSLINPLGLVHPSLEQHHFAISGVYSATNTYFIEFVVERVT